ncbi:MAG: hypothetical protein AB7Q30_09740 [Vicinamibacteria bacterium]
MGEERSAGTGRRGPGLVGWLAVLLAMAGGGFAIFGVLAWRAVRVERADAAVAVQRFEAARAGLGGAPALLRRDAAGRLVPGRGAPRASGRPAERLHVLAYRDAESRLVRAEVPLWFLELKAPAAEAMLRGTGLDPGQLSLSPAELKRAGPILVLDETRGRDRLLVWTE